MKSANYNLRKVIFVVFLSIIAALCMAFSVSAIWVKADGIVTSGNDANFYSSGAWIKLKTSAEDARNGIKFDIRVDKDAFDALENATLTIHMTFNEQTEDYVVDFEDATGKGAITVEDGFYSFFTYIYNIPFEQIDKPFTFGATISDGENEYNCATVTRSVSEVAVMAELSGVTAVYEENGWSDYISDSYLVDKTLKGGYETVEYTAYTDGTKNVSDLTYALFDAGAETVHRVMLGTNNVEFTAETTGFSLDAADIAAYGSETVYDVYAFTENHVYKVDLALTSGTISTTAGFISMLSAAKSARTQAGGFTGYYKLANDLDFNGVSVASNFMLALTFDSTKGWQATFDGQGYALKNINFSWQNVNGIFGEIGTNGVIKNVAIINPKNGSNNEFKGNGAIVAYDSYGLVENVYVQVASINDTAQNGGIIMRSKNGSTLRNSVIEYAGGDLTNATLYSMNVETYATISNCYAITSATFSDSAKGTTKESLTALYDTENNGLTMLTTSGITAYWGSTAVGEYVFWNDISTTAEFVSMLADAKTARTQAGGFKGYYRLTNDLDFSGVSVASNFMLGLTYDSTKGWQATFDGQGYALKNIDFSWQNFNGIFGEIGTKGVIKNVAIINPKNGSNNEFKGNGAIVAYDNYGLVENVYVQVASINDTANNGGIIMRSKNNSILRNSVIEYAGGDLANATLYSMNVETYATISNCYAITSATFSDSARGTTKESITALYDTANNGLTMLTISGSTAYWGSTAIGEYVVWNDISTTAEFVSMLADAKTARTQAGGFTGYYRLTDDLDFTGVSVASNFMLALTFDSTKGWQATFDGQGYALKNINFSWQNYNGIFGEIGANGVIKNVAIINPMNGSNNEFKGNGAIVAYDNYGLVENVYVQVASVNDTANNGGIIMRSQSGSVLRNCVVEYNGGNLVNATLYSMNIYSGATISNCYAITSVSFPDSTRGTTKDYVSDIYDTANNGLTLLTKSGSTIYWGSTVVGEYIEWTEISTTDQFVTMLENAKAARTQDGGFTGYYRLTSDLDFSGVSVAGKFMQTNEQLFAKSWQATFDGQGYALMNISMSWQTNNGIFGEIGTNGVIKNLAIINPTYGATNEFKGYGGIIANNNAGLIENVYVKIASMVDNASNAGLVRYSVSSSVIRNCVVEYNGGNLASSALYVKTKNGGTLSNCYAITSATFSDSANGTTKASVNALYTTANNGLKMLKLSGSDILWGNYKIGATA